MKNILILILSALYFTAFSQANDATLHTQAASEIGGKTVSPVRLEAMFDAVIDSKVSYRGGVVASGTNTYTGTLNSTIVAYNTTLGFDVLFTNANSGASTLNINSIGAIPIKKSVSSALVTGDILAGQVLRLVYDGTNFQIVGGSGSGGGSGGSGTVNSGTINQLAVYSSTGTAVSGLTAITANKALASNSSGLPVASSVTDTELGYVAGATSNIQTQINAKITNPLTTKGDLFYGGVSGVPSRLAIGLAGQQLKVQSGLLSYYTPTGGAFIVPGSYLNTFGDSFTYGLNSSPLTKNYANLLATSIGSALNNLGISATGVYKTVLQAYANLSIPVFNPVTWMAGLNDLRAGPGSGAGNSATYEKVKGGLRAFLAHQFLASAIPANSGSITQSGTWSTVSVGTIGEKAQYISGLALKSTVVSSTLTYTSTGNSVVIGTFGTDDSVIKGGTFTVSVDGTVLATFDNRNKTDGVADGLANQNNITQNAVVLNNLGNSTHTILITVTSLSSAGAVYIDYIGVLNAPINCQPALVASIPKLNTAGYATGNAGDNDAVSDQADLNAQSVLAEFPNFPAYWVYTNNFYSISNIDTDNIHPTNAGHAQIAQAFQAAVNPLSGSNFIYNTTIPQTANYSITGNAIAGTLQAPKFLATGVSNKGFFTQSSDNITLSINRDPVTGTFNQTSKASAQVTLVGAAGQGQIYFFASNTNNTTPTNYGLVDGSGMTSWYNANNIPAFRVGTSITDDGAYFTAFSPNAAGFASGAKWNGTDYIAKGTAACALNYNAGVFQFFNKTSLTSGTNFSFNEVVRIDATGQVGINTITPNSFLHVNGSFSTGYVAKSASYTLTVNDHTVEVTTGTNTQTLPTAVGITGRVYTITNSGTGVVTVATTSSQTFVNVTATPTTQTLAQFQTGTYQSNGANWLKISGL